MRKYLNTPMELLAAQLTAGLLRLRQGYVDTADSLMRILDPATEYPYEFVVYRLTGFRPSRARQMAEMLPGRTLRGDLQRLILDLCDSFDLPTSAYTEPVLSVNDLSRELHVSAKTIQRWCAAGLAARRLLFADGKKRMAFPRSTVDWFVQSRRKQVLRAMKFSKMSAAERNDVIRRAKRMASFTRCTLSEVSRRLAARTGRSVETIRYTLRNYDLKHPATPIFAYLAPGIEDDEKPIIYRCFLSGVSAPALAIKYRRTRGSIYRIIHEMRAKEILGRPIEFIYNPQFDLPSADEAILTPVGDAKADGGKLPAPPARADSATDDSAAYFRNLYDVPLLDAQKERDLFRQYNYLKYKADKLRQQVDINHVRISQVKQIESLLLRANLVKNHIIRANLRLVVSISKKHLGGAQNLFELISDGNVSLMRAVEKFDYSRGFRFSTYASWAIMRNFARTVPRQRYQLDHFATGTEEVLDIASALQSYDPNEVNLSELRESLTVMLRHLSPRERTILSGHYGLDGQTQAQTFDQIGKQLGISKERVRQIEERALIKLRQYSDSKAP